MKNGISSQPEGKTSKRVKSDVQTFHCTRHSHHKRLRTSAHSSERHLLRHASNISILPLLPAPPRRLSDLIYVERYENGGGYTLHSYADELAHLTKTELDLFSKRFFKTLFTERCRRGYTVPFSYFCIGVVHGAAVRWPELLNYFSRSHPAMKVNMSPLEHKNAIESVSLGEYACSVFKSYSHGIFRHGPMHAVSIVGVKAEERGCFAGDLLNMIESDPFLRMVTPWGKLSSLHGMDPHQSDDGPILWVRPGEQSVPICPTSVTRKRYSGGSDLADLLNNRRTRRIRQVLATDRTPCHADHADDGLGRHTTAAVGMLKAIYPPSTTTPSNRMECFESGSEPWENPYNTPRPYTSGRIIKDVVVFDPRHYPELVKRLRLDIMEPPTSQCGSFWADDGELNLLRTEGFSYVRLPLRDNDIYFIPRNVVHQFKTVSAGVSVAWHVRLKSYYQQNADQLQPTSSFSAQVNADEPSKPSHIPHELATSSPDSTSLKCAHEAAMTVSTEPVNSD